MSAPDALSCLSEALRGNDELLHSFVEQQMADWAERSPIVSLMRRCVEAPSGTNGALTLRYWRKFQSDQVIERAVNAVLLEQAGWKRVTEPIRQFREVRKV